MIEIQPHTRIFVATQAIDMRKGIDGIAAICRERLFIEPMDGAVFLFINAYRTQIKILFYDGQGFWLCMKRLSKGRFEFWPKSADAAVNFGPDQVRRLVQSSDWRQIR